jgi:CRP-like cAMP-binding protein
MNSFLAKIANIGSVLDVMLLTRQGDLLYYRHKASGQIVSPGKVTCWCTVTASLVNMEQGDFFFSGGHYYVHVTGLGYMIIGMTDRQNLEKIKTACRNVQQKISNQKVCKTVLLNMLASADLLFKPQIVKTLAAYLDQDVAQALVVLLADDAVYASPDQHDLLLFTCQVLGHCASREAVQTLKKMLSRQKIKEIALEPDIIRAVELSLLQLAASPLPEEQVAPPVAQPESVPVQDGPPPPVLSAAPVTPAPPPAVSKAQSTLPEYKQIMELVQSERKSEAIALILRLIEEGAKEKKFEQAESYRDLLIEVDSMALMDIIRAAEILEEAQKASISKEYFTVWKGLSEVLTPEEFISLYHAMRQKNYADGVRIAQQGQSLSTLFLINRGRVQLYAKSQGRDVPLTVLSQGEIFGAETFFEVSVWTVNAKSQGADLFLLPVQKFDELREKYPGFGAKFRDYCSGFQTANNIFRKTRKSRREFERKKASGRVAFLLLDKNGNEASTYVKGDMLDVSQGGLSFALHSSNRENALAMFGQRIRMKFTGNAGNELFVYEGVVMAVRDLNLIGNEYSLHIRYDKRISPLEMQQIVELE